MGPLSYRDNGTYRMNSAGRHTKCRDQHNCSGPGCRVQTGKTLSKRLKETVRK